MENSCYQLADYFCANFQIKETIIYYKDTKEMVHVYVAIGEGCRHEDEVFTLLLFSKDEHPVAQKAKLNFGQSTRELLC